jgi:microcystin degradation protein MlrC
MKIAIGSYIQESNFFSPVYGNLDLFKAGQLFYGDDVLSTARGTRTEVCGAMDVAEARGGVELLPLLRAMQSSSTNAIAQKDHETLRDDMIAQLRACGKVDAVFLAMHGAMSATECDDATGDVIRLAREVVGPNVPIVVTLDLHANITHLMSDAANGLFGYLTFPHIDLYETGERAMRTLLDAMDRKAALCTVHRKLPMIVPAENAQTTQGVIYDLMQQAKELMKRPGIRDISFFPMQPWMDVAEAGCAVVVVADATHRAEADAVADELADEWWRRRNEHTVDLAKTDDIIAEALASERKPWVLADSADAPSSGAPGDSPITVSALLGANPQKICLTNIVDPVAAQKMAEAGVGNEVTVQLGQCSGATLYEPITVTGKVKLLSDGDFAHKGMGLKGQVFHRGLTGVLQCGHVHIVVMSIATLQWDRELYKSLGLAPEDAQIVIVKSPAGFRADYEPIAAEVRILDAAGVCTPNLLTLPFKRIPHPTHPFDDVKHWR